MIKHVLPLFWVVVLAVALVGCPPEPPETEDPPEDKPDDTASVISLIEQRVYDLVNYERNKNDVPPLTRRTDLSAVARAHSRDMAANNYFNHVNLDDETFEDRLENEGITWRRVGENIAFNSGSADPAGAAVSGWMDSLEHRELILDARFTHTGIGVGRSSDGVFFFTQLFIRD